MSWVRLPGARQPAPGSGGALGGADLGEVRQMSWLLERLELPPGSWVLDPFAGVGTTARACLDRGCVPFGVEIEVDRVTELQRNAPGQLGLIHGDAAHLVWADGTFDAVMTNWPYPGFRQAPSDHRSLYGRTWAAYCAGLQSVIAEMVRVARPGAPIAVCVQNERGPDGVRPVVHEIALALAQRARLQAEDCLLYDDGSHEWVLHATAPGPDARGWRSVTEALAGRVAVVGSTAMSALAPGILDGRPPDLDLVCASEVVPECLGILEAQGFSLTSWGEPITAAVSMDRLSRRFYVRAVRDLAPRVVDLTYEAAVPLQRAVEAADPVTRIAAATDVQALMRARGAARDQERLHDWGAL